jgi:hypothetical protein
MASATNEARIKRQRAQIRKDRETDKTVIIALMSNPDGRRWVWNKLSEAQIFVEGESLDHAVLAYQKGMRNSGLRLLASVSTHTPEMYVRMTQENAPVPLADLNEDEEQQQD